MQQIITFGEIELARADREAIRMATVNKLTFHMETGAAFGYHAPLVKIPGVVTKSVLP